MSDLIPKERSERVIKKYRNRKLYDTKTSCYVTLQNVLDTALASEDVIKVVDNTTKADITDQALGKAISSDEEFNQVIVKFVLKSSSNNSLQELKDLITAGTSK